MAAPRFLQMHTLTAYPAALLNRDDAGLAKRIPFGGHSRTRISSQCLKRHWRTAEDEHALSHLGLPMAVRSRQIFERCILRPLVAAGLAEDKVSAVVDTLMGPPLFQESQKAKSGRAARAEAAARQEEAADQHAEHETPQVLVLGSPEIDHLREGTRSIAQEATSAEDARKRAEAWVKAERDNLRALKNGAGLDAALFGRMVTSDVLARKNAAVHVAHAFTVHAEEAEADYFTAVDDLVTGVEESGSGHLNETELTSGVFYGYVVVDVPQLVYNLEGRPGDGDGVDAWLGLERETAARVVEHLCHLIAKVSPGAKLGSTAPHSYAQWVLLEGGNRQPRTLANAFLKPVHADHRSGLAGAAAEAAARHVEGLDRMYGAGERRWLATYLDGAGVPEAAQVPFDQAVGEATAMLRE